MSFVRSFACFLSSVYKDRKVLALSLSLSSTINSILFSQQLEPQEGAGAAREVGASTGSEARAAKRFGADIVVAVIAPRVTRLVLGWASQHCENLLVRHSKSIDVLVRGDQVVMEAVGWSVDRALVLRVVERGERRWEGKR
jgi:hypothetical protein